MTTTTHNLSSHHHSFTYHRSSFEFNSGFRSAGGDGRQLSGHDIQQVRNRIERCLQLYMSKKEVMNTLLIQDNIDPHFTELVWRRLEEENQEFFKAYYLKLLVKEQIMEFNRLLSEQVELMRRIGLRGISPILTSNGMHVSPTQHISVSATQTARPLKTENIHQENVFNNCGSVIQPCLPATVDGSVHSRKMDVPPNLFLPQNTNVELAQTTNDKAVKTEAGYPSCSPFNFSAPGNYLESRPLIGDTSVSSFSSVDSNAHHLNGGTLLDGDTSSFGFLEQIPPSFSLPDMPADFATSSDLLESYCRPPYLTADANHFVDPHGDIVERLDHESESLRFQCFGGE